MRLITYNEHYEILVMNMLILSYCNLSGSHAGIDTTFSRCLDRIRPTGGGDQWEVLRKQPNLPAWKSTKKSDLIKWHKRYNGSKQIRTIVDIPKHALELACCALTSSTHKPAHSRIRQGTWSSPYISWTRPWDCDFFLRGIHLSVIAVSYTHLTLPTKLEV